MLGFLHYYFFLNISFKNVFHEGLSMNFPYDNNMKNKMEIEEKFKQENKNQRC